MTLTQAFAELQALDPKNPGAWPRWVHIAAAVLAFVVLLGVGIWTLVVPEYDTLKASEGKETTLRTEFEKKQKKVAALDAYKAQLDTMERDFGAMLRQLPSKTEVENLLNDISQSRVASSLEEELFQPQAEVPKEFYAEVPNRIVVTGTYHEMGAFAGGVAALPRIVTLDEVEIKPATGQGPQAAQGLLRGNLRMSALAKTYRYLDESEIAPATVGKDGKPLRRGAARNRGTP
ncbi:type 4a pilus biogenesis protein PilO [Nevskia sp.]|uniref:type 4a pilus biogenesis protein PilO n=1 Tax=Nevskia sp. TaxID=1929292 RepID=UPI0025FE1B30|nr:type 4a pilus biogenesis protein PilO [Nevskia sp.]